MDERILIAGGTGLLGRALADRLVRSGREVVLLSRARAGSPAERLLPAGCRLATWDARTANGWLELAEGARAIVNLAGESIAGGRWTAKRRQRIRTSRTGSTAAVLDAFARAQRPPGVLVQASAVGIYGDRADEALDERSTPGEGFLADTAREWEAASAAVEVRGVRRVLARTGLVLAREGGALPKMAFPFRFGAGAILGSGRQWMPWIHVEDHAAALEFVIDNAAVHGAINLGAPEPARQADFARELARALRRPLLLRLPGVLLRGALGEMAALLLDSQRVVPQRLLEAGFQFRFTRLSSALVDLYRVGERTGN